MIAQRRILFTLLLLAAGFINAREVLEKLFGIPQLVTLILVCGVWLVSLCVYAVQTWRLAEVEKQEIENKYNTKMNQLISQGSKNQFAKSPASLG